MKYKLHPYERAVGIFLGMTILGSLFVLSTLAVKQHWFEDEVSYITYVSNGSRIFAGSAVIYKGFKVGAIDSIEFSPDDKIEVVFNVYKKYSHHLIEGSQMKVGMSLLGEKYFEIIKPETQAPLLAENTKIPAIESIDLMKQLGDNLLTKVDSILGNLDQTLAHTTVVTKELEEHLPYVIKKAPDMTRDASNMMSGMNKIVIQMNELQPLMRQLATRLPEGTEKAVNALEESIIVLRAMQKSFFLSGGAEEARAEIKEERAKKQIKRSPASK